MWTREELKLRGKAAFRANYWRTVLVAFLISLISGGFSAASNTGMRSQNTKDQIAESVNNMSPEDKTTFAAILATVVGVFFLIGVVMFLLKIFVFNPLQVGCYGFLQENVQQGGQFTDLGILKTGFNNYTHTFVTMLVKDIFLALWFCLLIVPGVIKCYSYRMVPFILRDHPELSSTEVITRSREMMDGQKWNTFVLDLSFIGWIVLGVITCGIVTIFWTNPYMQSTNAALYLKLKEPQPAVYAQGFEAQ